MRQNWANNYYGAQNQVAAGAYDVNLNPYGSFVYGYGSVCHSYSGATLLYPRIFNPDSQQTMGGIQYYGSEPACP